MPSVPSSAGGLWAVLGQGFLGKAICISSLEKSLFTSFAHFLIGFSFLKLNSKISIYILDIDPLPDR